MMWNLEVIFNKFNMVIICSRGNYINKGVTELCDKWQLSDKDEKRLCLLVAEGHISLASYLCFDSGNIMMLYYSVHLLNIYKIQNANIVLKMANLQIHVVDMYYVLYVCLT
jgi:hypothetical protein